VRARRYHSHPVFAPKPSLKDAENQRNYQALFRCTASGLEPFVGGIVGPFDVQLPTQAHGLPRAARGGCRAVAWRYRSWCGVRKESAAGRSFLRKRVAMAAPDWKGALLKPH